MGSFAVVDALLIITPWKRCAEARARCSGHNALCRVVPKAGLPSYSTSWLLHIAIVSGASSKRHVDRTGSRLGRGENRGAEQMPWLALHEMLMLLNVITV